MRILAAWLMLVGCGRVGFAPGAYGGDGATDDVDTSDGLVVWFPMDTDAISNGTIAAVPSWDDATCASGQCPARVPGVRGGAGQFDGTDFGTLADGSAIGVQPYSVATWFQLSACTGGDRVSLVSKARDDDTVADVFNLTVLCPSAVLDYETDDDSDGTPNYLSAGPAVIDGTWHHAVASWDGETKRLYLDGALITSVATTLRDATEPIHLGVDFDLAAPADGFAGLLDDVRIYDRALADDEVAALATP